MNKFKRNSRMKTYKGHRYFLDKDGLWKVVLSKGDHFAVALDDSKMGGGRRIAWENNNEKTAKLYIDLLER